MRFKTNAPQAYDYGYTVNLGDDVYQAYPGAKPISVRMVEIPERHAAYQTDRYRSGLYIVKEVL